MCFFSSNPQTTPVFLFHQFGILHLFELPSKRLLFVIEKLQIFVALVENANSVLFFCFFPFLGKSPRSSRRRGASSAERERTRAGNGVKEGGNKEEQKGDPSSEKENQGGVEQSGSKVTRSESRRTLSFVRQSSSSSSSGHQQVWTNGVECQTIVLCFFYRKFKKNLFLVPVIRLCKTMDKL